MPIPNTITRVLDLPHPQEKVWAALTTTQGLAGWFGSHADGVVEPGQSVKMRWQQYDDAVANLDIQVVDPLSLFAYTWPVNGIPDGDPRKTYVEFRLEAKGSGTLLTMTESGFAQLPDEWLDQSYNGNNKGWDSELGELVAYLDAA